MIKKVLALALVATMALSMGMGAFAFDGAKVRNFADGVHGLVDGINTNSGSTDYVGDTHDMGDVYFQDEPKVTINLFRDLFIDVNGEQGDRNVGGTSTVGNGVYRVNMGNVMNNSLLRSIKDTDEVGKTYDAIDVMNDQNLDPSDLNGFVAAIDDIAAAIDVLNAATPAITVADVVTSRGWNLYRDLKQYSPVGVNQFDSISDFNNVYSSLNAVSGFTTEREVVDGRETQYISYLTSNGSEYVKTTRANNPTGLFTAAELRDSKFKANYTVRGGSKVVDSITLNTKDSTIDFELKDEYTTTKDHDFETTIYLSINGKRMDSAFDVTILGNIRNKETIVYADDDYVDCSEGYVAVADEFNSGIEIDAGKGVTIYTKLFKGKKYYIVASRDADEAADIVFSKYPDVDNVVIINREGVNSTGDVVKFDTDYYGYWVYGPNMEYLGKATDKIPLMDRYYLANRELDVDADDVDEEPEEDEPSDDDGEGDDDDTNANANPGTGR